MMKKLNNWLDEELRWGLLGGIVYATLMFGFTSGIVITLLGQGLTGLAMTSVATFGLLRLSRVVN